MFKSLLESCTRPEEIWLIIISELQSIAQSGLHYCSDDFCKERYKSLNNIAAHMLSKLNQCDLIDAKKILTIEAGYLTPKIDVRGAVFTDNKILLVKEAADNCWSLPGGWCDINESPSEAIVREIFEETGHKVKAVKLAALFDKQKHAHPLEIPHAYKCFFLCEPISSYEVPNLPENNEILQYKYFAQDNLPQLSKNRVLNTQIDLMFKYHNNRNLETCFD